MNTGDVLRLGTQGGGGYGDPLERPATKVWDDVQDGYVSPETARRDYGVVCDLPSGFDAEATEALRKSMHDVRGGKPLKDFDFGPVREAYHQRWPSAMHDAISALVQPMPRVQRQIFFRALYEEIDRRIDAGEKLTPDQVPGVLAALQGAGQKRTTMKRAV